MTSCMRNPAHRSLDKSVTLSLGWDARATTGVDFDLDASAIGCGCNGKALSDQYFVFYNNLRSPDGAIEHVGDNLSGTGAGDDEVIRIDLTKAPQKLAQIILAVSIHDAAARKQKFGTVSNAFVRLLKSDGTEFYRFDLSKDAASTAAIVIGALHRQRDVWDFRAVGESYATGLAGIARYYRLTSDEVNISGQRLRTRCRVAVVSQAACSHLVAGGPQGGAFAPAVPVCPGVSEELPKSVTVGRGWCSYSNEHHQRDFRRTREEATVPRRGRNPSRRQS